MSLQVKWEIKFVKILETLNFVLLLMKHEMSLREQMAIVLRFVDIDGFNKHVSLI
jgi:hypothetical protein